MIEKNEKKMYTYAVEFYGTKNISYLFDSYLDLKVNGVYMIETNFGDKYKNPVKIISKRNREETVNNPLRLTIEFKIIVKAKEVCNFEIRNVWFNEEKGVTVVKWKDDTKTIVRCQHGEKFDKEKGLALCFMKKLHCNNSSFNEVLKHWCHTENPNHIVKKEKKDKAPNNLIEKEVKEYLNKILSK